MVIQTQTPCNYERADALCEEKKRLGQTVDARGQGEERDE